MIELYTSNCLRTCFKSMEYKNHVILFLFLIFVTGCLGQPNLAKPWPNTGHQNIFTAAKIRPKILI